MNIPTLKEIASARRRICNKYGCENCPLMAYKKRFSDGYEDCSFALLHAVISGKLTLDGKPVEEQGQTQDKAQVKPALPKWCKVGAWAFRCDNTLVQIIEVKTPCEVLVRDTFDRACTAFLVSVRSLSPVRFHPYTLEEAIKLLGKTMKTFRESGEMASVEMITDVRNVRDTILINKYHLEALMTYFGATIDGVPIGVPEVDTEAEKEVQK